MQSKPARHRATFAPSLVTASYWIAWLVVAAGGCSGKDRADSDGTGGRAGTKTGGRAGTETGGSSGAAASTGGSAGPAGEGGSFPEGGGADTAGAGNSGGSGVVGEKCGNGKLEGDEACDDGNNTYGDGCFTCQDTSACDECWRSSEDDYAAYCFDTTDPMLGGARAQSGPAAGTPHAVLCTELMKCAFEHGCGGPSSGEVPLLSDCWCGRGEAASACDSDTMPPIGPCVDAINRAAEPSSGAASYALLAQRLGDPNYALGIAFLLIEYQKDSCAPACDVAFSAASH